MATPLDKHDIDIRIKDRAGNTSDFNFSFKVEFVPPPPVVTSTAINPFNKPFPDRATLYGQVLLVSEYLISNDTGFPMLFSVSDAGVHSVLKTAEEAVRKREGRQMTEDDWRLQFRYMLVLLNGQPRFIERQNPVWQSISSLPFNRKNPGSGAVTRERISRSPPFKGSITSFATDHLPAATSSPWAAFHLPLADTGGANYFEPLPPARPEVIIIYKKGL